MISSAAAEAWSPVSIPTVLANGSQRISVPVPDVIPLRRVRRRFVPLPKERALCDEAIQPAALPVPSYGAKQSAAVPDAAVSR